MRHRAIFLFFCAIAFALCPCALFAQTSGALQIPVILSLTGGASFIGKGDQQSLKLLEDRVNKHGGINQHPLHFDFLDDGSNAQTAVQLANQVIAAKAAALIGPSLTQQCNALAPLVLASGPATYCLSPGVNPPAKGYMWSSSVSVKDCIFALMRYLRARGITRVAMLSSTDATGQEAERDLDLAYGSAENTALKKAKIEFVAREHFNLADVTVGAQLTRIKAAKPEVLVTWTVGPAFGTELRGIADSGVDIPIVASSGNMVIAQLSQYASFMPKELLFTAVLPQAHDALGSGPVKNAQTTYFDTYKAAGVKPDFVNTLSWDPGLIMIDAFRHLGNTASAAQIRDYINGLHGFAGINGIYDFRDGEQHGVGENSVIMVSFDLAKSDYAPVSKRGGRLK